MSSTSRVRSRQGSFVALAALSVLAISAPGIAQKYTLTPVGNLGGKSGEEISEGFGINNAGDVVGSGFDVKSNLQAFFYSNGHGTQMLPPLDPTAAPLAGTATAINLKGTVVGYSTALDGAYNAVMWPTNPVTAPTDLGSSCLQSGFYYDSKAYAINSNSEAAGTTCSSLATADEHAALFSHGTVTDLGTLGGTISEAFGINESGIIVGYSFDPSNNAHAFSWDGSMHDLGTFPGGLWSYAYAINASGVIVGYSDLPGVGNGHAFMVSPGGTLEDLTPGSPSYSQATAINTSGQIVGRMGTQAGVGYGVVPFLYSNGKLTDLNTIIDKSDPLARYVTLTGSSGLGFLIPVSINDNGWIVADGTDSRTGAQQAYLLIPNTSRAVTLSPTKLSFLGQPRTTTSAAQTVKLTSGGIASLRISSITPSSGFVVKHTCPLSPATLGVGTSCMISVSSRPTIDGPYSGSVKIVDDAAGSPHTVPLAGTGTDFSISASPTSQTSTPGTPVHYTVTVAPRNGFKGAVALSCTGAPTGATCAASPASLTINGTNSAKSTVTVVTRTSTPKATYTLKFAGQMSTLRETISVTLTLH